MKKILITGASGFLGKNLAESLSVKYNLLLPAHKALNLINAGEVKKYLEIERPDIVIHTAGVGLTRKENNEAKFLEQNLAMFNNLSDNQHLFKKMLFCGSGAVYDKSKPLSQVTEEAFGKTIPQDVYGKYKYECSSYIVGAENIIDLRLFGVFGKYEDYSTRFISNTICKSLLNMPVKIFKNVFFEYLYVNDFVEVVDFFINNEVKYKAYNVGNGRPISLLEIAEKIKFLFNPNLQIGLISKDLGNEYSCSNSRLTKELENFKFKSIDESLIELYNWYKEHLPFINQAKLLS